MIGDLKAVLSESASEWGIPTGEWGFIIHNNYQLNYSGINIFWFHNHDRDPCVVTKIFPEPSLAHQEFRNLQDAYPFAPGTVPKPLTLCQTDDYWTLWMSGISGTKLSANHISDAALDRFCDDLVAIQKGVSAKRPASPHRYRDCILEPVELTIQQAPQISAACRRVLEEYTENRAGRLPVLQQHGDLYIGNIIVNGSGEWAIVDWELLGIVDLPFFDVVKFLFSLGEGTAPDRWHPDIQRGARRLISRYTKALGIDPREFLSLLPILLANWFYCQPLIQGKETALGALRDCLTRPANWERVLLA